MPFAVELFLDPTSASTVRRLWRDLAEADTAPAPPADAMIAAGARPHITLGACERLDVAACETYLAGFAATTPAPTVGFASLGVFPTEPMVVFLAPVVTADLLAIHDGFHRWFRELAGEPWGHYLPGRWVPHCTLALDLPLTAVPAVAERCLRAPLPSEARLLEVGLVEFEPFRSLRHCFAFRFAGA
jgi:2'-5' RNA ligase